MTWVVAVEGVLGEQTGSTFASAAFLPAGLELVAGLLDVADVILISGHPRAHIDHFVKQQPRLERVSSIFCEYAGQLTLGDARMRILRRLIGQGIRFTAVVDADPDVLRSSRTGGLLVMPPRALPDEMMTSGGYSRLRRPWAGNTDME